MISEVYNEDCMIGMARFPDKFFDLAVVDPPYGFGVNMNMGRRKGKRKKHVDKIWDDSIPSQEYFSELMRVSKNQIIWGGNYFPLPPSKCFIVWDKGESIYGRDFAEVEQAWASFDKAARIIKLHPNQNDRIHPTQKPIKLYTGLYKRFLNGGGVVLDTHLGSGSNRIAADKAGNIDFYGFELDKDYFDAQEKRWMNYKKQLLLF